MPDNTFLGFSINCRTHAVAVRMQDGIIRKRLYRPAAKSFFKKIFEGFLGIIELLRDEKLAESFFKEQVSVIKQLILLIAEDLVGFQRSCFRDMSKFFLDICGRGNQQ